MPTYEYLCKTCSHRFETWQKMTDDPLEVCPECGAHIRRVYYPAGIVFKGSGFYKTDHRSSAAVADTNGHEATKQGNGTNGTDTAASETKTSGESKESKSTTSESHPVRGTGNSSSKSTQPSENKVTATTQRG
ncbi:MAG: FmdB family zinc ribbon protein [Ktedonobacteraceae bacterium]